MLKLTENMFKYKKIVVIFKKKNFRVVCEKKVRMGKCAMGVVCFLKECGAVSKCIYAWKGFKLV